MKKLVPVEESSSFMRDPVTNAVLNTDLRALEMYRAKKKRNAELDKLKDDVCCLKDDISELKQMIGEVLRNRND